MKLKLFFVALFMATITFGSYAQKYKTVAKNAKVDFTLSPDALKKDGADDVKAKAMQNKIVELKGKVIKTYSISSRGDLSKGKHYVEIEVIDPVINSYVTAYFATSQEALMGKEVTIKGEFFKVRAYYGLWHCVLVAAE